MIEQKFWLVLIWLGILTTICIIAFAMQIERFRVLRMVASAPSAVILIIFSVAAVWVGITDAPAVTSPLMLSFLFLVPFIVKKEFDFVLGGLAALPLLAAMIWWSPDQQLGLWQSLIFIGLGWLAVGVLQFPFRRTGLPKLPVIIISLSVGVASGLFMSQFSAPDAFCTLWHHWGAYVAPVQALLAGGIPFHDFPVQYGMGPTMLIAALGHNDPWLGLYLATAFVNILYILALVYCAWLVLYDAPRGMAIIVFIALIWALILWAGSPLDEIGPVVTPSSSGMRFLPLVLLVMVILYREHKGNDNLIMGYSVWLFSLAWSPEAGIYATIVWFPYIALRAAQRHGANTPLQVALIIIRGVAVAGSAFVAGMAALVVLFWFIFGQWPELAGFLTYILNPPGMMSPNLLGPVWLALAVMLAAVVAMTRANEQHRRTGMVCLLEFGAVSSYYIGRSHDNNILNLFQFLVLVLAFSVTVPLTRLLEGFVRIVLVGLVAFPAAFGFDSLQFTAANGQLIKNGLASLLDNLNFRNSVSLTLAENFIDHYNVRYKTEIHHAPFADLGAALAWLDENHQGMPLVVNILKILPRMEEGVAWTGVNNKANFDPLPPDAVLKFILNGAKTYHRSGWVVVDNIYYKDWIGKYPQDVLGLFQTSYNITQERMFGAYTAYKLEPK